MKRHVYDITITIIIISIMSMSMSEVIKVSWDEIGAGDWGVPGSANAPESYDWFDRQPCQDVEYNVVWEIILPSSEEDRRSFRLWHFSTEELKNRDNLREIRGCCFFIFILLLRVSFCFFWTRSFCVYICWANFCASRPIALCSEVVLSMFSAYKWQIKLTPSYLSSIC